MHWLLLLPIVAQGAQVVKPEWINGIWFSAGMATISDSLTMIKSLFFRDGKPIPMFSTTFVGAPVTAISDWNTVKEVLNDPECYPNAASTAVNAVKIFSALTTTNLLFMNGENVKKYHRLLLRSVIGEDSMTSFKQVAESFCEHIAKPSQGKTVDVLDAFQRVAMDAMNRSLLGMEAKTINNESTMLDDYRQLDPIFGVKALLAPSFWVDGMIGKIKQFKSHLVKQFAEYSSQVENKLLINVLKRAFEANDISHQEAIDLMTFMFVAGQETVAITMSNLSYYLAKHPEYQAEIRKQVLESSKSDLLTNCVYETLRLNPPSLLLQSRNSKEEKHGIPKNQKVWIPINSVHRNPDHWREPDQFNPRRFEGKDPRKMDGWMAFGLGTRSCPGRNFALKEITEVMKIILMQYSIHLPVDSPHHDYLHTTNGIFLKPRNLQLIFHGLSPTLEVLPLNQPSTSPRPSSLFSITCFMVAAAFAILYRGI